MKVARDQFIYILNFLAGNIMFLVYGSLTILAFFVILTTLLFSMVDFLYHHSILVVFQSNKNLFKHVKCLIFFRSLSCSNCVLYKIIYKLKLGFPMCTTFAKLTTVLFNTLKENRTPNDHFLTKLDKNLKKTRFLKFHCI
ncbi:hypothetical protein EDEG_00123 [Edhazardia aedis USNM 41457]|uniref:Uncharacterized protein n=1 Tax=Edhazardia aedis (strain USNM 41457) TaxID=1003232 RepID=J8ZYZ1_EDHAE|nr:hypothetical protein EDEG_00123 [Edhazardia aedis USNM 41457]|eukprot:EJW04903.1 hypothetical protein EDEG_00123 [Edhazardia aedis USNM 41457]